MNLILTFNYVTNRRNLNSHCNKNEKKKIKNYSLMCLAFRLADASHLITFQIKFTRRVVEPSNWSIMRAQCQCEWKRRQVNRHHTCFSRVHCILLSKPNPSVFSAQYHIHERRTTSNQLSGISIIIYPQIKISIIFLIILCVIIIDYVSIINISLNW